MITQNHYNLSLTKYDYLVLRRAAKYRRFANYEDLVQEGRIALMQALKSYNSKVNDNFEWWADQYIKTRLIRQANKHCDLHIPMDEVRNGNVPIKVSSRQLLEYIDQKPNAEEQHYSKEVIVEVRKVIDELPKELQKIVKMFYGVEYTSTRREYKGPSGKVDGDAIDVICQQLHMSRMTCVRHLRIAQEILRNRLGDIEVY